MTETQKMIAFDTAADRVINSLGACDDEFNHWHLDHGNLRHLFAVIWQAALAQAVPQTPTEAMIEAGCEALKNKKPVEIDTFPNSNGDLEELP